LLYRKQEFEKLQQEGWSLRHGTQLEQQEKPEERLVLKLRL
jgi:hypothetical protein